MTEFFRNFPQLRAGLGPRESTGIDSIPRYFGHDLDTVCGARPSDKKPDGRVYPVGLRAPLLRADCAAISRGPNTEPTCHFLA